MKDMIKMVVVLTILSAFSGGLLAAIRDNTQDRIQNQQLTFVKGPAVKEIFEGASNDPIADRFEIEVNGIKKTVFVAKYDGEPKALAMESYGKGYGGDVGLMVGINMEDDTIRGVAVTTHAETPGIGAKAKEDPVLSDQFKGLPISDSYKVNQDGGQINSISGATITSRAVTSAASQVGQIYQQAKSELQEKAKQVASK